MLRLFAPLMGVLFLVTSLAASPSTPKDTKATQQQPAEQAKEVEPEEGPFVLTKESEVLLDGRVWSYDAIPDDAIIMNMQVDRDRRTIVRIHFRSR